MTEKEKKKKLTLSVEEIRKINKENHKKGKPDIGKAFAMAHKLKKALDGDK